MDDNADSSDLPAESRTRCEVWTRVMGYHRPISQWNKGKQAEHAQRVPYLRAKAEEVGTERTERT